MTNRVSGPPLGEAPARSSLVPRDLTAELCLIALASLGRYVCVGTPYGVFVSVCSILCYLLRSGFLLLGIRLTAFWFAVVGWLFVPCLFRLCLVLLKIY